MYNDQQYNVFFELLRSGMWGSEPEVTTEFDDWDKVAKLAKSQSVLGIVGHVMLNSKNISHRIPESLKVKLKKFLISNIYTHNLLNNSLIKVVSVLNDGGVESVLLKGQGLARNYPNPELRQCGDIDLYVGCQNARLSQRLLAPIALAIDSEDVVDIGKHYQVAMQGGVDVEIHRYTDVPVVKKLRKAYQEASDRGVSENLVPIDFAGISVNTPSDDFNAFYIFNHLFHHFLTSGIGLRQFCDWMMFLHTRKGKINLVYLEQLLTEMNLFRPWQAFGCVLVELLGMPQDEFPFYDRSQQRKVDKIVRRVLEEGNFGKERKLVKNRGEAYWFGKARSFVFHIFRTCRLIMIFPLPAAQCFAGTFVNGFAAVWKDVNIKFKECSFR